MRNLLSHPKSLNISQVTLAQSMTVVILSVFNGIFNGLTSCLGADKTECSANSVLAILLVILTIGWFAFLSAMAYAVWVRRTTMLIILFTVLEIITVGVSAFGVLHYDNIPGRITSIIDLLVGLWALSMCYFVFNLRGTSPAPQTGRKRSVLNQAKPKK